MPLLSAHMHAIWFCIPFVLLSEMALLLTKEPFISRDTALSGVLIGI